MAATERGDHVTYVAMETGTYIIDVTHGRLTVPGRRSWSRYGTLRYWFGVQYSVSFFLAGLEINN